MKRVLSLLIIVNATTLAAAETLESGINTSAFDRSVRAQDDLFMAVNGSWLRETEIPADKSNYGSFIILADQAQEQIRDLVEQAAKGQHERGSDEQKVGDFYRSFMDEARLEELGLEPLTAPLEQIRGIDSVARVIEYWGASRSLGVKTPVGFFVDQDDKDSSQYLAAVVQSGTTLPDRSYYLEDDEKYRTARTALQEYISQLFVLAGSDPAEARRAGSEILELETRLAQFQWERTELRDAEKRYNKYALDQLADLTPDIDWKAFLKAAGVGQIQNVNVMTPSFFKGLEKVLAETPLDTWRKYLQFHLLDAYAPALSTAFVDAHFELHDRVLAGVPAQQPRWKRAVEAVAGAGAGDFGVLGDVVGRLYVGQHFRPDAKHRMDQLVANLLRAFGNSIDELSWMTDETKLRARQKLSKITTKIGYPAKWRDYSALDISANDLMGNLLRSSRVEYRRMIDKLGKPVDRQEWGMTPQTVNAYYNPGLNEIVFPAAILQPPFFSMAADDAVNYGGIGAVIGHEISHAFDDQGSKYDGDGNLQNWWTARDRQAFKELTARLVAQYEQYQPLPGKHVNGQLTLGENIADLSGLAIAFKAYQISLNGATPPEIDGWTGDQRFFLGWSQVWRRKYRDAEMIRRLLVDPHSPSWYRANGPVSNIDAFYEAFQVQAGDQLYKPKEERIRIW